MVHFLLSALREQRLQLPEAADEAGFWCYHKAEHHFGGVAGTSLGCKDSVAAES